MTSRTNNKILLRVYSPCELAKLYGVSTRTFSKWLKPFLSEIGERCGRFYTIRQVKIIFEKLCLPDKDDDA